MGQPVIIDCFPFYNELDLLELRLRELDGVADRVIAIQAEDTHAGQPKPIYLNPDDERWAPWRHKLETHILPAMPVVRDRWDREHAPRHALANLLSACAGEDLVILSDADEIPDRRLIAAMAPRVTLWNWVGFSADCFYYYLNLKTAKPYRCIALAQVATIRQLGAQTLRNRRRHPPILAPGGWHFSYLGGVQAIREKLAAFAHEEYDTPSMKDPERLAWLLAAHRDLYKPFGPPMTVVPLKELPEEVQQHPDRYVAHLVPEERP